MPVQGEYTMRAQPRRRKEGSSKGDEPVFLRKTYDMINTCDPSLACWSIKGDTFLIKNPERFASEVIPTFFKHSKFSSFVRQLNFYGFRKVKSATALDTDDVEKSQWWEFKHDLFTRGTPDLLSEIKRATHYVAPPEKEVDALKGEVSTLQARVSRMDDQLTILTGMIQDLIVDRNTGDQAALSKKRKIWKNVGTEFFQNDNDLYESGSMNTIENDVKSEFIYGIESKSLTNNESDTDIAPELDFLRTMSLESTSTTPGFFDSDLLEGLSTGLQFTDFDTTEPISPLSVQMLPSESFEDSKKIEFTNDGQTLKSNEMDASELAHSIMNLPLELQEKLRDGVLSLLKSSESDEKSIENATDSQISTIFRDSHEVDMQLSTAALSALLTQFSHRSSLIPLSGQIESMA